MGVVRFGVSLEDSLLEALDEYVLENSFPNRSQALRYLVEKNIVEKKWQCNNLVAGAVVLTYPADASVDLLPKMLELQRAYASVILTTQYMSLSNEVDFQIIALKGKAKDLTEFSDKIIALKGVTHGKLLMSRVE